MEAIKFTLGGKTAFFKKPDVNKYYYFTYQNVHKIALLGMLGAILGLKGYTFQGERVFPEFYKELKNLKIAIQPLAETGIFNKSFQIFTNSVGYAGQDNGTLIVKEQWIEEPQWDIYILAENNNYFNKLKNSLLNNKCEFIPYLGKNDHPANISNVEFIEELQVTKEYKKIHTLCYSSKFKIDNETNILDTNYEPKWKYEEYLPVKLDEETNQYILEMFILTNNNVSGVKGEKVYSYNNLNLFFF